MAKRKRQRPARKLREVTDAEIDDVLAQSFAMPAAPPDDLSALHTMFDQQTRAVLDSSDLDEEQKQSILLAMACPCCGGGGAASLRIKLKPRS